MEYVNLGSTGLKVSRLCLGTMTYGSKNWREWVLEEEEGRVATLLIRAGLDLALVRQMLGGATDSLPARGASPAGPPLGAESQQILHQEVVRGAQVSHPDLLAGQVSDRGDRWLSWADREREEGQAR